MKKILFFVAALFIVNGAFSQDVKFGIKAGANFSSLSPFEASDMGIILKIYDKDGMSFGYHGGVFANISFGDLLGFQPEFLFSMQGGKMKMGKFFNEFDDDDYNYGSIKFSYQFGYISLPLLLEIKPVDKLGILVGPQIGYNIISSATAEYEGQKGTISGSEFDEDIYMGMQKFDAGIAMGLQYSTTKNLHIGARYYLGLIDGYNESYEGLTMKGFKNSVIQVSLGFSF